MELEITIKVPVGPAGVAVEQQTTGLPTPLAPVEPVHWPPPVHRVEDAAGGNGAGRVAAPSDGGGDAPEVVHEPPSLAEFGIMPAPSADDAGPPPLDMLERSTPSSGQTDAPPGLEGVRVDEFLAERTSAVPPDLPDISQVPVAGDEFAPPPIDDLPPAAGQESNRNGPVATDAG